MEYKKFGNTLIVRLDRGEEVVDRLLELARREHITLASVNGLGAADDVTVGVYFPATQEYKSNQFQGEYEISLSTAPSPPRRTSPMVISI